MDTIPSRHPFIKVIMFPILLEINGIPIYAHGFFLNLALLVCLLVIIGESRRWRWPKQEIIPITLAAFVGGMIGARVSIVFFNGWETAPVALDFYHLFDPHLERHSRLGREHPPAAAPVDSQSAM